MLKKQISIILIILFTLKGIISYSQSLPIPEIVHISVQNQANDQIVLKWECSDTALIDGYIIYRNYFDTLGIIDGAFLPIIEISDKNTFEWIDKSFETQNPNYSQHNYAYEISSFKIIDNNYNYSKLSTRISSLLLYNLNWSNCNSQINLSWKNTNLSYTNLKLNIYTENNNLIQIPLNISDSSFQFNVSDFDLSSYPENWIAADIEISCQINNELSKSNRQSFRKQKTTQINLFADSLILNSKTADLYFHPDLSTNSNIDFYTASSYINNLLKHSDTLTSETQMATFNFNSFDNKIQYQIQAFNSCGQEIGSTAKHSPLTILSTQIETEALNTILLKHYPTDKEQAELTELWVAENQKTNFKLLNQTIGFSDQLQDLNLNEISQKTYYSILNTLDTSLQNHILYRSNQLTINKKAIIQVPTAIYLTAQNPTDRAFQIKSHFITDFSIEIFNSIGKKIFESKDLHFQWEPEYPSTGINYTLYFYVIKYKNSNAKYLLKKGKFLVFY